MIIKKYVPIFYTSFSIIDIMGLLPNPFGIFGKKPQLDKQATTQGNQSLTLNSSPQLPTQDLAKYVTENPSIPDDVKLRNWADDLTYTTLGNLSREDIYNLRDRRLLDKKIERNNKQRVSMYWPGVNLKQEREDLLYDRAFTLALFRAEGGKQRKDLLQTHTSIETTATNQQPSTPEKKKGIQGFLGL